MEDNKLNTEDIKFTVMYSYFYEKYMFKFYSHLNIILFFGMIITTLSLMVGLNRLLFGSFLIILLFIQILLQADIKAQKAKGLYKEYLSLFFTENIDIDQFRKLQLNDSEEIDCFSHPAYIATLKSLGCDEETRNLTLIERLAMIFIAEIL